MKKEFEKSEIAIKLVNYKCPRYDEFPNFGMYVKQVIEFLDKHLLVFSVPNDEKMLTSTMVNNYVKQKVISAPVNRKYYREQIIHLFVINIFKQVLTISEIAKLLRLQMMQYETSRAYNFFCEELENNLKACFLTRIFTDSSYVYTPTPLSEVAHSAILAFANKIYVRQNLYWSYNS
ncbi:MAG: DUF1836 domain-containing protein [Bdellovibrionota bacterium]